MKNNKKIITVLPAYNAEKTLKQTLDEIPRDWIDEIILVDDASADGTVALSKSLGIKTFVHKKIHDMEGIKKLVIKKRWNLEPTSFN